MKLPAQDKLAHFSVGMLAMMAVSLTTTIVVGVLVCTAIACFKELYDARHRGKHTPEGADFLWTVAGAIVIAVWLQLKKAITSHP